MPPVLPLLPLNSVAGAAVASPSVEPRTTGMNVGLASCSTTRRPFMQFSHSVQVARAYAELLGQYWILRRLACELKMFEWDWPVELRQRHSKLMCDSSLQF